MNTLADSMVRVNGLNHQHDVQCDWSMSRNEYKLIWKEHFPCKTRMISLQYMKWQKYPMLFPQMCRGAADQMCCSNQKHGYALFELRACLYMLC